MKYVINFLTINLLGTVLFVGNAFSEPVDCKNTKPDKIKTGVVASVGTYGTTASVDSNSSTATPGEEDSVIRGSIQSHKPGKCLAVITNQSECFSHNVSFAVSRAKKSDGKAQHVTSSSASVPAKGSKDTIFSCDEEQYNYAVEVTKVK